MHAQEFCARLAPCAKNGTVVGTVASQSYRPSLLKAARAALATGFACVAVSAFDDFPELHTNPLIRPLPPATLLPNPHFCTTRSHKYGWRRSQLYRTRLWVHVLACGYDLLATDLDWALKANPMAMLHAARPNSLASSGADIVAVHDGPMTRYLNVGIMWIRSTSVTRELAIRTENRSFVGWDQEIFNEELNFNSDFRSISCCHTMCLKRVVRPQQARPPDNSGKDVLGKPGEARLAIGPTCAAEQAPSLGPPKGSPLLWSPQTTAPATWRTQWKALAYNEGPSHKTNRPLGRCTELANTCVLPGKCLSEGHA